jgi:hypothetical protein
MFSLFLGPFGYNFEVYQQNRDDDAENNEQNQDNATPFPVTAVTVDIAYVTEAAPSAAPCAAPSAEEGHHPYQDVYTCQNYMGPEEPVRVHLKNMTIHMIRDKRSNRYCKSQTKITDV